MASERKMGFVHLHEGHPLEGVNHADQPIREMFVHTAGFVEVIITNPMVVTNGKSQTRCGCRSGSFGSHRF